MSAAELSHFPIAAAPQGSFALGASERNAQLDVAVNPDASLCGGTIIRLSHVPQGDHVCQRILSAVRGPWHPH